MDLNLTAVILCGGKGERLRPYTDHIPKPLLTLRNIPILLHLMRFLGRQGVRRYVLCTGYKAECIEQFVRGLNEPDWEITCVNSGDATMTQRLADAWQHVEGRALICYGDTLANVSLRHLLAEHDSRHARVTLTVYPLRSPFGIVSFNGSGAVQDFSEKPQLPYWINVGFMLCEPEAIQQIRAADDMPGFLESLSASSALFAFQHNGKHLTINTEKERVEAETEIDYFTVMDNEVL